MIAVFNFVVTITLNSGRQIRFRADKIVVKTEAGILNEYEIDGGEYRLIPRYLRISEVAVVQWRKTFLGIF